MYTRGSAQLGWEVNRLGSLQPRRMADFIVYRADPLARPVDDLLDLHPVLTVAGGQSVYDLKGLVVETSPAVVRPIA